MLRVGERILLLALSDDSDKHPLGYLSSRLLADVSGAFVSLSYFIFRLFDTSPRGVSLPRSPKSPRLQVTTRLLTLEVDVDLV